MPKKNDINNIINEINSEIEYEFISGDYINNKSKLTIKHTTCGKEFIIDYDHWKRGQRCNFCGRESQKYSHEKFIEKLDEVQPGKYTVLSKYTTKRNTVKVKCNTCGNIFEALPCNLYRGTCSKCAAKERSIKYTRPLESVNLDFDDYEFLEYVNNKTPSKVKHKICGHTFTVSSTNLRGGQRCPFCYSSSSLKEKELYEEIRKLYPSVRKEKLYIDRKSHKFYEIDMYIPELKLGIEFDGLYWHSEAAGKDKNYHLNKTIFCNQKGIHLIHIFEDEYNNKKEIVLDKIKSYANAIENKIFARKCEIKEILANERNAFLNENHIQ